MKNEKIAICSDNIPFHSNRIFDEIWANNFPGAQAMPILREIAQKNSFQIVTGDIALSHVKSNYWQAKDVLVAQEQDSQIAKELISLGAEPKILLAFESPVFAPYFYDSLPDLAPKFCHRILFKAALGMFDCSTGTNHKAYFPSYHKDMKFTAKPWAEREFLVIVAANKYCKKPTKFPFSLKPAKYLNWYRKKQQRQSSRSLQNAIQNELQSQRLEAIEYFGADGRLSLFGASWKNVKKFPPHLQKNLKKIMATLSPERCLDKVKTIANYKFSICFENISYPGYVTEKIIDCFVAGVIPIYLGAPDIFDFVPEKAFIDMRKFNSWHKLDKYLEGIEEEQAIQMIKAGQNFLLTPEGKKHSFEFCAKYLFELILQ